MKESDKSLIDKKFIINQDDDKILYEFIKFSQKRLVYIYVKETDEYFVHKKNQMFVGMDRKILVPLLGSKLSKHLKAYRCRYSHPRHLS